MISLSQIFFDNLLQKTLACIFIVSLFFLNFKINLSGLLVWSSIRHHSLLDFIGLWALRSFSCEVFSIPWAFILSGIHITTFYVSTLSSDLHLIFLGLSLVASAVPIGCTLFWRGIVFVLANIFFADETPLQTLLKTHQILFSPWPTVIVIIVGNVILLVERLKQLKEGQDDIETGPKEKKT